MGFFKNIFGGGNSPEAQDLAFDLFSPSPFYSTSVFNSESKKLKLVLGNPALLKVFCLQCDLFSLGEVYVEKDKKIIEDDPFLTLINNPNPFEEKSEFLWNFMFWNMLGNSYCFVESNVVDKAGGNKLYILESNKIEFPDDLKDLKDKLVLSNKMQNDILEKEITYRYDDGSKIKIKLKNIIHTPDMGGSFGNWFKSPSRVDALYKIIANSEASLDSENINIRYSGKFMVAGKADPNNVNVLPMHQDEKEDIETKMNGKKAVHAVKSMIDIKRFVEDMGALQLDQKYLQAYFLIGSMYNIPRDVLEAYNSSTYENQEKARGAHVSYSLQPKGNSFLNGFEKMFGYREQGKNIYIDWEHLPFMQIFAKQRAETDKVRIDTLLKMKQAGIPINEINSYLGTNFSKLNTKINGTA